MKKIDIQNQQMEKERSKNKNGTKCKKKTPAGPDLWLSTCGTPTGPPERCAG